MAVSGYPPWCFAAHRPVQTDQGTCERRWRQTKGKHQGGQKLQPCNADGMVNRHSCYFQFNISDLYYRK